MALGLSAALLSASTGCADDPASSKSNGETLEVLDIGLRPTHQSASPALSRALRRAVVVDSGVGGAIDSAPIRIVARARVGLAPGRDMIGVMFRGRDGVGCFGVSVLTTRGSPRPFYCVREPGTVQYQRVGSTVIAVTGLLDVRVRHVSIDFGLGRHADAKGAGVPVIGKQRLNAWMIAVRSPNFPLSVVLRDASGRAIGGFGDVCVAQPRVCDVSP